MKPDEVVGEGALELVLPARPRALAAVRQVIVAFARGLGADEDCVQAVAVGVNEAATNAVVHAYRGEGQPIRVAANAGARTLVVSVSDDGVGEAAPRREGDESGRGLPLMRGLSARVEIRRGRRGTEVRLAFPLVAREAAD
jgi:serine/threonine-protein kinase RsbW